MTKHFVITAFIALIFCLIVSATAHAEENYRHNGRKYMEENFERCAKEKEDYIKILCISSTSTSYNAFMWLYGLSIHEKANKKNALDNLRLQSISARPAYNEKEIYYIKLMGIHAPEFYHLFHEAMAWGDIEKQKTAEELYHASQAIDSKITNKNLIKHFKIVYLRLAANKGHKQARIELDAIIEAVVKEIRKNRAK